MCIPRRIVLSEAMKELYIKSLLNRNKSLTIIDKKLLDINSTQKVINIINYKKQRIN